MGRRMLKIVRIAQRTTKSIVEELEEPVRLCVLCKMHIIGYFGHGASRNKNLEKKIIFSKVPRFKRFNSERKISYQMGRHNKSVNGISRFGSNKDAGAW